MPNADDKVLTYPQARHLEGRIDALRRARYLLRAKPVTEVLDWLDTAISEIDVQLQASYAAARAAGKPRGKTR